jgi:hypothetical protein
MKYEYIFSFEKLIAWQDSRSFIVVVYSITAEFPKHEL